jgi:hypothetical protein
MIHYGNVKDITNICACRSITTILIRHLILHSLILARISESRKRWNSYVDVSHPVRDIQTVHTYLLADLDSIASPARKENTVASLDRHRNDLAVLVGRARPYGDDGSLRQRRVRSGGGEEETSGGFLRSNSSIN